MRQLLLCGLLGAVLLATACNGGGRAPARRSIPHTTTPPTTATSSRPAPYVPTHIHAHRARWHLPYAVARAALVPTGGASVLLAGGLTPGDLTTGRSVSLDLATGRSEHRPPLVVPVHDTAAGLVAGTPTLAGGGNTSAEQVVQSLSHGAWRRDGNLPTTRSDLSVVEWHHHAGELLRGVRYAATARLGADVYIIGGVVDGRELATVQRLDLTTGRAQWAGHIPLPLGHAMAIAVSGRILVMGGRIDPTRPTDAFGGSTPPQDGSVPPGTSPPRSATPRSPHEDTGSGSSAAKPPPSPTPSPNSRCADTHKAQPTTTTGVPTTRAAPALRGMRTEPSADRSSRENPRWRTHHKSSLPAVATPPASATS